MRLNRIGLTSNIILLGGLLIIIGCSRPDTNATSNSTAIATDTSLYELNNKDLLKKPVTINRAHGDHYAAVDIRDMKFNPETVMVNKGDTIEWMNDDLTAHCITESGKHWTSGPIASGASWVKVISENADYYCAIHLVMKGHIGVR